jgi:pimeloyl-ACP methyl ester carboxylesterase
MQTVTSADGTEIAYRVRGEGPPLVLFHGGGTHEFWAPLVGHLTDDWTVYTPDRRGHGASGDREEYALEREIEDARAVIDAVEGRPAVVGHSFGGLMAIEAAREADVAAVVAYEPAVLVGEYRQRSDLADRMESHLDAGDREAAMKAHLREVLFDEIGDDAFEAWLDDWEGWPEAAHGAEHAYRMDREIERYELSETLEVGAPALLLTGTKGPAHLRDSVRAVAETIPDSRLVEFDGVPHMGPVEAPERTLEELSAFLAETVATAQS